MAYISHILNIKHFVQQILCETTAKQRPPVSHPMPLFLKRSGVGATKQVNFSLFEFQGMKHA